MNAGECCPSRNFRPFNGRDSIQLLPLNTVADTSPSALMSLRSNTVPIVRQMMRMSSQTEVWSTYQMSSANFSFHDSEFRPLTCAQR